MMGGNSQLPTSAGEGETRLDYVPSVPTVAVALKGLASVLPVLEQRQELVYALDAWGH